MGTFTGALGLFGGETGAGRHGWRTIGETNISHMRVTLSSEAPGSQKLPQAGDSIKLWRAIRPIPRRRIPPAEAVCLWRI